MSTSNCCIVNVRSCSFSSSASSAVAAAAAVAATAAAAATATTAGPARCFFYLPILNDKQYEKMYDYTKVCCCCCFCWCSDDRMHLPVLTQHDASQIDYCRY